MNKEIEGRAVFTFEASHYTIPCTVHKGRKATSENGADEEGQDRIGIVFLNSLSPTRAARGDSCVSWADGFAARGYPCFRVDLPGFGDSATDPPEDLLEFINLGGYGQVSRAIVEILLERFRLSSAILFGLCAGAVSAIYAAAASKDCSGVILLDPYFYLPKARGSSLIGKVKDFIPPGALRRGIRSVIDRSRDLRESQTSEELPDNANLKLLDSLKTVISSGRPIMMINAPAVGTRKSDFDYCAFIRRQAMRQDQVAIEEIAGADHTFSNLRGRAAVTRVTEKWLSLNFPVVRNLV